MGQCSLTSGYQGFGLTVVGKFETLSAEMGISSSYVLSSLGHLVTVL
jgi:hypothetical protein